MKSTSCRATSVEEDDLAFVSVEHYATHDLAQEAFDAIEATYHPEVVE